MNIRIIILSKNNPKIRNYCHNTISDWVGDEPKSTTTQSRHKNPVKALLHRIKILLQPSSTSKNLGTRYYAHITRAELYEEHNVLM